MSKLLSAVANKDVALFKSACKAKECEAGAEADAQFQTIGLWISKLQPVDFPEAMRAFFNAAVR